MTICWFIVAILNIFLWSYGFYVASEINHLASVLKYLKNENKEIWILKFELLRDEYEKNILSVISWLHLETVSFLY